MHKTDIIIPTCKPIDKLDSLIKEIKATTNPERVSVILASSLGSAAKNRNDGLDKATAPFVCMIDDDVEKLEVGWCDKLVATLEHYESASLVSARLMRPDGSPGVMCANVYEPVADIQHEPHLPTACIAFYNTHKRFDETFIGSGFEDNDWCNQLGGNCLIDNSVKVVHRNEAKNQSGSIWQFNQDYFGKKTSGRFKFVALYKTYSGGEWLPYSLASIYDYVDAIVVVQSLIGWDKKAKDNDCLVPLWQWRKEKDKTRKITELTGYYDSQDLQYKIAYEFVRKYYPDHYILLIDSDEIWDARELQKLQGQVRLYPEFAAYKSNLYCYVKNPLYRIDPPESICPTVIVNGQMVKEIKGPRGMKIEPALHIDCRYHHFSWVRTFPGRILEKLSTIQAGEGMPLNQNWYEQYWNKIPSVTDFHPSKNFEGCWKGIKVIQESDLPPVLRGVGLMEEGTW